MNAKLEIAFFVFTSLSILFGAIWAFSTESRLHRFFLGKKGKDLEDTIGMLEDEIKKLNEAKNQTLKDLVVIEAKLKKSLRGLETIRFNPFPDQGSNQSFAIGLLNEEGDGVVLSSLYSRERMSIFAKPIKNHKSTYELSDEEKEALDKAKVK